MRAEKNPTRTKLFTCWSCQMSFLWFTRNLGYCLSYFYCKNIRRKGRERWERKGGRAGALASFLPSSFKLYYPAHGSGSYNKVKKIHKWCVSVALLRSETFCLYRALSKPLKNRTTGNPESDWGMRPMKRLSSNSNGNSFTASSLFSDNENSDTSEVRMTEAPPRRALVFAPRRRTDHEIRISNASVGCLHFKGGFHASSRVLR